MATTTNPAEELFFQADQKIRDGFYPEAKDILRHALSIDPKFGRAYNHLGWICETKYQEYKKAEEYYQKALELSPEYPATYVNLAILLSTLEKNSDLEKHLDRALKVYGINKATIYREYGIMHERMGNFAKAMESFKKALTICIENDEVRRLRESIDRCEQKIQIMGISKKKTKK